MFTYIITHYTAPFYKCVAYTLSVLKMCKKHLMILKEINAVFMLKRRHLASVYRYTLPFSKCLLTELSVKRSVYDYTVAFSKFSV